MRSELFLRQSIPVSALQAYPKYKQRSELNRITNFLPPLPEQRAIAEILSTWDEAIAVTEQLIAALEKRKKGLMQRLLTGQVRFPGFDQEWRRKRLVLTFAISKKLRK